MRALFAEFASASRYGFSQQELSAAMQAISGDVSQAHAAQFSEERADILEAFVLRRMPYHDRVQMLVWMQELLPASLARTSTPGLVSTREPEAPCCPSRLRRAPQFRRRRTYVFGRTRRRSIPLGRPWSDRQGGHYCAQSLKPGESTSAHPRESPGRLGGSAIHSRLAASSRAISFGHSRWSESRTRPMATSWFRHIALKDVLTNPSSESASRSARSPGEAGA